MIERRTERVGVPTTRWVKHCGDVTIRAQQ
jgi:hypothetical protein